MTGARPGDVALCEHQFLTGTSTLMHFGGSPMRHGRRSYDRRTSSQVERDDTAAAGGMSRLNDTDSAPGRGLDTRLEAGR